MITIFENYTNKPDVNSLSPKYWKMIQIANWNAVIKGHKENPSITGPDIYYEDAQNRVYSKYTYEEIQEFLDEFHPFYISCYEYFEFNIENVFGQSGTIDDNYSDYICSMISKGKIFTKKCIDDSKFLMKMIKNKSYEEGFWHLFDVEEEEYWEIKFQYDPLLRDMRRYNL